MIYRAFYDSKYFHFEAYGINKQQAREAIIQALKIHAAEYDLDPEWFYDDDIFVQEFIIGMPYRDGSEMNYEIETS